MPWARYHLAALYEADGKNEVAAGQIASVLAARPGRPLLEKAVVLLARTVAGGGDCRFLGSLPVLQLKPEEQRYLAFARAECAHRASRVAEAEAALVALLRTKVEDDPALLAAERLAQRLDPAKADARTLLLVGTSFYEHRDFVAAIPSSMWRSGGWFGSRRAGGFVLAGPLRFGPQSFFGSNVMVRRRSPSTPSAGLRARRGKGPGLLPEGAQSRAAGARSGPRALLMRRRPFMAR